jgi:hypothetical protein
VPTTRRVELSFFALKTDAAVQTRLDRIKDAVLQEGNEAAAEAAMSAANHDGDAATCLGSKAAQDEVTRGESPTQYAEHWEAYWQALSAQTVKRYIKLVAVDGQTQQGIAQSLEDSAANMCNGQEQRNSVLVLLDVDLLCESVTCPSDKRAPLPAGVVQRLLRGCMQGRGVQNTRDDGYCQPLPGDLYVLHDSSHEYLTNDLLEAFAPSENTTGPDASVKVFHLSEPSLRVTTTRQVRGSRHMMQGQCTPLVPHPVPEKNHTCYQCQGANRKGVIGLITLDPKVIACQPFDVTTLLDDNQVVSSEQDEDVVFYHHLPCQFYANLVMMMSATAIIDLAAGAGSAAKSALVMNRPYWGLCLSEHHVAVLYRHLVHWVLSEMGLAGSPLFNPEYAKCKGLAEKTASAGMPTPKPERKRKPAEQTTADTNYKRRNESQSDKVCDIGNAISSWSDLE